MDKKILAGVLAASFIATSVGASYTEFGSKAFGSKSKLTVEEQATLETLTDEEKKEFFTEKKELAKEAKSAKEEVIDALLAGDTLTSEQEEIRSEIITERAEMKEKIAEKKALMEELQPIIEKKKSGEELSEDEQALLDESKELFGKKSNKKSGNKDSKKGGKKTGKSKSERSDKVGE